LRVLSDADAAAVWKFSVLTELQRLLTFYSIVLGVNQAISTLMPSVQAKIFLQLHCTLKCILSFTRFYANYCLN